MPEIREEFLTACDLFLPFVAGEKDEEEEQIMRSEQSDATKSDNQRDLGMKS
jgi:hypothetical protein